MQSTIEGQDWRSRRPKSYARQNRTNRIHNHRTAQQPLCPVCGTPITTRQVLTQSTCADRACRIQFQRWKTADRRRQQDKIFEKRHAFRVARATAKRDSTAADIGIANPDSFAVVVIPGNNRQLKPLPANRRRQFERWLLELVDLVFANPVEEPLEPLSTDVEDTPLLPIYGETCGTCKGRCCLNGGTRAFLDSRAIHRFRNSNRECQPREIITTYCRHLPEMPYENSCVYHTEKGCALSRDLRSDTCNSARCGGLSEIRWLSKAKGQKSFFIASMWGDEIMRSKFIK